MRLRIGARSVGSLQEECQEGLDETARLERECDRECKRTVCDVDMSLSDVLFKLYKRRAKRPNSDEVAELDGADCPEGVDEDTWARLLEYRQRKLMYEAESRHKQQVLTEYQR